MRVLLILNGSSCRHAFATSARERSSARHRVRNPNTRSVVYPLGQDCVPIVAHAVILPLGGIAIDGNEVIDSLPLSSGSASESASSDTRQAPTLNKTMQHTLKIIGPAVCRQSWCMKWIGCLTGYEPMSKCVLMDWSILPVSSHF